MKITKSLIAVAVSLAVSPALLAEETLEKTRVEAEEEQVKESNKIIIGSEQVDAEMITDIFDTVRYIPGVDVNNTGNRFGANGFNIRGLEGNSVAITVDGIIQGETLDPVNFSRYGMFSSNRNAIEPESVKTIEILKGANSVVAGSGALGGAVMYTTKEASDFLGDSDVGGSVKLGYDGRNEEFLASVAVAKRIGNVEGLLIVTRRDGSEFQGHSDGADIEGPARGIPDPFDIENTNILARLEWQVNDAHRLGLVFEDFQNDTEGTPLHRNQGPIPNGFQYFDFSAFDESSRERIGLTWQWNANLALFDTFEAKVNSQEIFTAGSTFFQFSARGAPPYLRNEDRNYTQDLNVFMFDFTKQFETGGAIHDLAYGVEIRQGEVSNFLQDIRYNGTTVDSGLRDGFPQLDPSWIPDTDTDVFTAYISDRIQLNDQWTLQLGARYDKTEYDPQVDDNFTDEVGNAVLDAEFSALVWAANLGYEFMPGHRLTASVGTGYRAPTTQELYFGTNGSENFEFSRPVTDPATGEVSYVPSGVFGVDYDAVTNPDLDAEESINYEVSYNYAGDNGFFSASAFMTEADNLIINLPQTIPYPDGLVRVIPGRGDPTILEQGGFNIPVNAGEVEITGFEISAGWYLTDNWSLDFAHTNISGEYTNSFQGNTSVTGIDSVFEAGDDLESVAPDNTVIGLDYNADIWGARLVARFIEEKEERDSFAAEFYTDSATVVDLSAFYNVTDNTVIRAGIFNLFDEKYALWQTVRLVRSGNGGFFGGITTDEMGNNGIDRFNQPGREFQVNVSYAF